MSKQAHCAIERDYGQSAKVTIERHGERPSKQTKNSAGRRKGLPKTRVFVASGSSKPESGHLGTQLPSAALAGGSGASEWDRLNKILDELITSDADDEFENANFKDTGLDDVQPNDTVLGDTTLYETIDASSESRTKRRRILA
ncbi:hypothetical protein RhiJN_23443 [Ceratobasidium sp. AG-Ba]|nr:hypothetical protein RhiJN_23443 [Ceratobasidium sp. AG-Ba]